MKSYKPYGATHSKYRGMHNSNSMPIKRATENHHVTSNVTNTHAEVKSSTLKSNDTKNATENTSAKDVLRLFQNVSNHLSNKNFDPNVVAGIVHLNAGLKIHGPDLEITHKDELNRLTEKLRKACQESDLDLVARLQALEVIEMRNMKWVPDETILNYYKQKVSLVENSAAREALDFVNNTATFNLKNALSKSLASTEKGLNPYAPDFTPTLTARNLSKASDALANMLHLGPACGATSSSDDPEMMDFRMISNQGKKVSPRKTKKDKAINLEPPSPSGDSKAVGDKSFARVGQEFQEIVIVGEESIKLCSKNSELIKKAKHAFEEYLRKPAALNFNLGVADDNASLIANQIVSSTVDACFPSSEKSPSKKENSKRSPKKHVSISEDLLILDDKKSTESTSQSRNRKIYDRKSILKCAESPFSRILPMIHSDGWDQVGTNSIDRYDLIFGGQNARSKSSGMFNSFNKTPRADYNHRQGQANRGRSYSGKDHSLSDDSHGAENETSKATNGRFVHNVKPLGPVQTWDEFKDEWVVITPSSSS